MNLMCVATEQREHFGCLRSICGFFKNATTLFYYLYMCTVVRDHLKHACVPQ